MSVGKKALMAVVVTVVFFVLLEGVLALAGVDPKPYADDPFVGFTGTSPLFVPAVDGEGRDVLRTADSKLRLFNRQSFPLDKGENTKRVFCLGGSTTFGRPYDDATSFCGWLREMLPVVDPDHDWEVINAGGVSYASYRVALLMEEVIDHDPDLLIVYTGQNEFLEARTYSGTIAMPPAVRGVSAAVAKTRVFSALDRVLAGDGDEAEAVTTLGDDVVTRLDASVGPDDYHRDDEQRQKIIDHFRFNLARMADIAHSADAAMHLVVPASNLEDCSPFKSDHADGLDDAAIQRWQALMVSARQAVLDGQVESALAELERAREIDPRHAATLFSIGTFNRQLGRPDEALRAFEAARDEDVCPLRMLGGMADIVREVAAVRELGQTDFEAVAADHSPDGIPGSNLFLDHVHPTIEGNGLLARSILEDLIAGGAVEVTGAWDDAVFETIRDSILDRVDDGDRAQALMKLSKVLGWAGKIQDAFRLARQAVQLAPTDAAVQYQAGLTAQLIGQPDEAIIHYRNAIAIQPDADLPRQNLGVLLQQKGDFPGAIEQFRAAIQFARSPETTRDNTLNLADALVFQGVIHYRNRQFEEAIQCFSESRNLVGNRADTVSRLGQAYLASGQAHKAILALEEATRLDPSNGAMLNTLAVAYVSAGRLDEGAAAWRKALRLAPELKEAPNALPRVLEAIGRSDLLPRLEKSGWDDQ